MGTERAIVDEVRSDDGPVESGSLSPWTLSDETSRERK